MTTAASPLFGLAAAGAPGVSVAAVGRTLVGMTWGLCSAAPELGAWTLAAVCGVLLATGAVNLRQAAGRLPAGRSVRLAAAGVGLLAPSTRLAG